MSIDAFKGKHVLVTGGTGMIGIQLVNLLLARGADVTVASMDDPSRAHPHTRFLRLDLTKPENCDQACAGQQYIFNLVGIKGSPKVALGRPASFFVTTVLCNTNIAEAARKVNPEWYLYTSSVGVYAPAEIFHEADVWKTFPSENDRFAGWAKRMGELLLEAYKIEYGFDRTSIVRPANVYGPYDNFNPVSSMVVPSLIKRAVDGENPFTVWGDGSSIRDFVHARDVARGMMFVVENKITAPVNLGSGKGISIKELVEEIIGNCATHPEIVWDTTKPSGDAIRRMDMSTMERYGFKNEVSLHDGIKETMDWYTQHRAQGETGYNIFNAT